MDRGDEAFVREFDRFGVHDGHGMVHHDPMEEVMRGLFLL